MNQVIIVKEYSKHETVEVLETVLFTKLTEQSVGKSKMKQIEAPVKFIEFVWGLNLSKNNQIKTIKKIIVNSVIKN
jgi:hypothetical protein